MTSLLPRVPDAKVALATASVYPESTANAFEIAARLGYDGVEVMVWTDPVSQDIDALKRLRDYHQVDILAIHAPCLVITQRVWGTDPWAKLVRAREVPGAKRLGSNVVEILVFRGLSTPLALLLVVLQGRFLEPTGRGRFVLAVLTVSIFSRLKCFSSRS